MPYEGTTVSIASARDRIYNRWISKRVFMAWLAQTQIINFSVTIERTDAITATQALRFSAPYNISAINGPVGEGEDIRFDLGADYIDLDFQPVQGLFVLINQALSYKDRTEALRTTAGNPADPVARQSYNDAFTAFNRATNKLCSIISNGQNSWNTYTFESYHRIVWVPSSNDTAIQEDAADES